MRLRGLKAKLEAIQPEIDDLRLKVADSEEQMEALKLKLKVEEKEQLLTNLGDVVRIYEEALRQPVVDIAAEERVQLMEAGAEESAGV